MKLRNMEGTWVPVGSSIPETKDLLYRIGFGERREWRWGSSWGWGVTTCFYEEDVPFGYLRQAAGDHRTGGTSADHDEVVAGVQVGGSRSAARVLEVALGAKEDLEQAHEEHVGGATAGRGQGRPRLRHRTIAGHLEQYQPALNAISSAVLLCLPL